MTIAGPQAGQAETPEPAAEPPADTRYSLGTVRNAVTLLDQLAQGPVYHQLTELAERSGMSLPTVHRLLRSLVSAGLVEQDARSARYGLGPEVVRLSQRYLSRLPVLAALSPYLRPLRDSVGRSISVMLLIRGEVTCGDRIEDSDASPFREPHRAEPALDTAAGRLLAARADDLGWQQAIALATPERQRLAQEERQTWRGASHLVVARDGHSGDEVAVPVTDAHGRGLAAISTMVADPADIPTVVAHLNRAAQAAGRTLGHD